MSGLKRTNAKNRSISITEENQIIVEFADRYIKDCVEGKIDDNIKSFTDLIFLALKEYLRIKMASMSVYLDSIGKEF